MTDIRSVDYSKIHLEESKLHLAEGFVDSYEDFNLLTTQERNRLIVQVAKMATAAECFIFDGSIGASHMNSQVYMLEDGRQKAVILLAEKREKGVVSDIVWTDAETLRRQGFDNDELRQIGFEL